MANKEVHELTAAGTLVDANLFPVSQSSSLKKGTLSALATYVQASMPYDFYLPCGDQSTVITTGTAKLTFLVQRDMTLTNVYASLKTAGTGTATTFDINKNGTTMLSTKLTIDATETSSRTAATAAVISVSTLSAGDIITVDFDGVGTNAVGPVVYLVGKLR